MTTGGGALRAVKKSNRAPGNMIAEPTLIAIHLT